jgi:very-short-patch-repair endonuclease
MKLSSYPHLVKEWHPTKNGELTPKDFASQSHKKAWWLCPKGHSYDSIIGNRAKKKKPTGCPYCAGQKVSEENNLLALFPEIAKDWHPTKNNELTPKQVTSGGNKKVWWLCPKGHSYESTTSHRTAMKSGCPYCSGHKVSEDNNLLFLFPEIAKEWHPTKNGVLTPKNFTTGVDKIIWWLCPKGHSYESMINNRTQKKYPHGCPYCSGRRVGEDNNLLFLFPEIAKEWHPTMNGELTPEDFTHGSTKKVWWQCPKGHHHESAIKDRTIKRSGCPYCSNQSSEPEIRILSELKWFFEEVNNRYKVNGVEIDIFLPNLNIGIEYDGNYWHKDKEDIDLEKNEFLLSKDIHLIRVRQHPLKPLSKNDVIVSNEVLDKTDLDEILKKIVPFIDNNIKEKITDYFDKLSFVNDELFNKYRSYFPSPIPDNSLLKTHPLLNEEWDYEKNYPLRPENFSYGSHQKIWWLCPESHSYSSVIKERTNKNKPTGCPYCAGKKTLNYDLFK